MQGEVGGYRNRPPSGAKDTPSVSATRAARNYSEGDSSIYSPPHERHRHRSIRPGDPEKHTISACCKKFTNRHSHQVRRVSVRRNRFRTSWQRGQCSAARIALENNEKIRPQPDRENAFARASGGSIGIRTLETVPRLHTFQACAFDHSATCPLSVA